MSEQIKLSLNRAIPLLAELAARKSPISIGTSYSTMSDAALEAELRGLAKNTLLGTTRMLRTGLDVLGVVDIMGGMLDDLRTKVGKLENTLINLSGEKQSLAEELERKTQELIAVQNENARLSRSVQDLKGELGDAQRANAIIESDRNAAKSQVTALQQQIRELVPQIEAANKQLDAITGYLKLKPEQASEVPQTIYNMLKEQHAAAEKAKGEAATLKAQLEQKENELKQKGIDVTYVQKAVLDIVEVLAGDRDDLKIDWAIEKVKEMKNVLLELTTEMGMLEHLDNIGLALGRVKANAKLMKERGTQLSTALGEKLKLSDKIDALEAQLRQAQLVQNQSAPAVQAEPLQQAQNVLYFNDPADLRDFLGNNPDDTDPQVLAAVRDYLEGFSTIGKDMADVAREIIRENENLSELHARLVGKLVALSRNTNDQVLGGKAVEFLKQFDPNIQISVSAAPRANEPTVIAGEDKKVINGPNYSINTDLGTKRAHNEDSAGYAKLPSGEEEFVVCDGMGGHAAGDVASRIGVDRFLKAMIEGKGRFDAVTTANQAICDEINGDAAKSNMGSTLAALGIDHKGMVAYALHAGDSRVMAIDASKGVMLTRDHSQKMMMFNVDLMQNAEGPDESAARAKRLNIEMDDQVLGRIQVPKPYITDEEADQFDNWEFAAKNVITSGLGGINYDKRRSMVNLPTYVTLSHIALKPSANPTMFLIFSDGAVDGAMRMSKITEITRYNNFDPAKTAEMVKQYALDGGSADNVTVVAVTVPYAIDYDNITLTEFVSHEGMYADQMEMKRETKRTELAEQAAQAAASKANQATREQLSAIAAGQPEWKKRVAKHKMTRGFFSSDFEALTHYFDQSDITKEAMEQLLTAVMDATKSKQVNIHLSNNLKGTEIANLAPAIAGELKRMGKKFRSDIYIFRSGNGGVGIILDQLPPNYQQYF
ncbi:MAG TPA: hypothetical protein VMD02_05070 [Candidatus Omnitrophota bacterium]|nr:hypothetical protein [Candidatus Omnitrophota bacterium]